MLDPISPKPTPNSLDRTLAWMPYLNRNPSSWIDEVLVRFRSNSSPQLIMGADSAENGQIPVREWLFKAPKRGWIAFNTKAQRLHAGAHNWTSNSLEVRQTK